ncbi:glycoside hydrolase [Luteolibacter arcticus]|uniref:Glycoside hydrolase n=1 Tax=Luteolibacter arcticus TaxID=1581411 RepID=A0ABT3GIT9_9BACT|nr:sialidase family protein [Luteolibacter arcticus]MCW1923401.1 glycoside hydrolase [Luteolibacter arcticus]
MKARLPAIMAAVLSAASLHVQAAPAPPPGQVIHHSPASSRLYIGSPSLCVMPDGSYVASHDLFGPGSKEYELAKARLYRSTDKGATWQHVTDFDGYFWTGIFVHRGAAFTLGTDMHHGKVVIRRSVDSGKTWTAPVVLAEGEWHTAPMPVIEHQGRIWRAIEDAMGGTKWGERYRARMMSAPVDADLLDPKSWTFSNPLARNSTWLGNDFAAWLEGNAVADPEGNVVNLLRVDNSKPPEKAAIVRLSKDGTTATFDADKDFIEFPGGAKKFTIRQDPQGGGYWSIASIIPERHGDAGRPASIRNTLALIHSKDLRTWETRCVLLYHPDVVRHGFQYVDWQFEGEDLIAVCRTAWDDKEGGARNNHDANFLTFHRWKSFRTLSRKDDVPMPEFTGRIQETGALTLNGVSYAIGRLETGAQAFSNRGYRWQNVPQALEGKSFTRLNGGAKEILEVTAKRDTVVRIAIATGQTPIDLAGWTAEKLEFSYDDSSRTRVVVHSRPLEKGNTLRLPRGNWTGAILILDEN